MDEATKLVAIETVERLGSVARRLWPQIRRSGARPYAHPTGYPPHYLAERAVEAALYTGGDKGVRELIRDMKLNVAELQGSMARRTGEGRRQNPAEWEQWNANDPLPAAAGPARRQARSLFQLGRPYEYVLWLVATSFLAGHPPFHDGSRRPEEKLSRREAHKLQLRVDAAWSEEWPHEPRPSVPRGWWHYHISQTNLGPIAQTDWIPTIDWTPARVR